MRLDEHPSKIPMVFPSVLNILVRNPNKLIAISNSVLRALAVVLIAGMSTGVMAHSQENEWTWVGGSSTLGSHCFDQVFCGHAGVYGRIGTPAKDNLPGSRTDAASWTDGNGNLWLFGGDGYDASGYLGNLNDVWEFNPSTGEWAWMGGSDNLGADLASAPGVYGSLGTPSAENIPGGRWESTTWVDHEGNVWLFGGSGQESEFDYDAYNDLWKFNPSTNEWAWMGGSMLVGQNGTYGALKASATGNIPGAREGATGWTDSGGHLWLFGGQGYDSRGNEGYLNDLWEFDPSTNEWAWMGGSKTLPTASNGRQPGVYGKLGTPAPGNVPGGRVGASGWTDSEGHLWLFGGAASTVLGDFVILNDLWEFDPATNEWAWMGGSSTLGTSQNGGSGEPGVYGTLGTPAVENAPGSRWVAANWTGNDGRLWLFGGEGNDSTNHNGDLNDLWMFDPSIKAWAWMGGSSTINYPGTTGNPGVYGKLGTPAPGNIPGGREAASSWVDDAGHFWMFGGDGYVAPDNNGFLNDLWEFLPSASSSPVPTFSPAPGAYTSALSVTIGDLIPGAKIYFTTDEETPTAASTLYKGRFTVSSTETIKAIAVAANYANSAVATAKYIILKPQTITFTAPRSPVTYGVKPIELSATASSKLPVTFKVISGPGTISGHKLTITGAGTVVIAANQAGNLDYAPAPQVERKIVVDKASQTIAWPKISGTHYAKTTLHLKATATSGLPVSFTSETPKVCTVSKDSASLLIAGACTIRASQPGNDDYAPAPALTHSVTVTGNP